MDAGPAGRLDTMNIILILADQLSAKWLGCYGNPAASTPHLDAMARRGVLFERCYSNLPVCMSARASIMTGRSAQHHGVFYNRWELGLDLPTFPQVLQRAGVDTLGVGKFHLECHGRSAHNDVLKYGFDRALTTEDIRAGDWIDWIEVAHPDLYERALATVWEMPHLAEYGPTGRNLLEEIRSAQRKHRPSQRTEITYPSLIPEEICQTRWIGDTAVAWIRERDPAHRFFLKVSFVDPHDPYDPPESYLERIDPEAVPGTVQSTDPRLAESLERFWPVPFVQRFASLEEKDWRTMRRHYLASLAFIDDQVGRIWEAVCRQGLEEETVLIFTADHGDMLGDHGLVAKGAWHFDACYHIPLLMAGPGTRSGRSGRVVTILDLFPTLLDFADAHEDVPVEGQSLRPLADGGVDLDRADAALVESYGSYGDLSLPLRARSVISLDTNLTLFGDGTGMLFDLRADPQERVNLFGRPEAAVQQAEMKDLMLHLLDRQNEPLPARGKHPTALH